MSDDLSEEFIDAYNTEMGRLYAADVIWMAQRIDLPLSYEQTELRIADGPYTRLLRRDAQEFLDDVKAASRTLDDPPT